jgi:hypothetical protein
MTEFHVRHPLIYTKGENVDTTRPVLVCLCGSTRFYDAFQQAAYERTMAGEIVLTVGFYPHSPVHGEGVGHDSEEKARLDELHKRKIDMLLPGRDYVLVVSDETGYFGHSTRGEIAHAEARGIAVQYRRFPSQRAATAPSERSAP